MEVEDCSAYRPTPLDFASFVHYVCAQLEAPFVVKIIECTQGNVLSSIQLSRRFANRNSRRTPRSIATVVDLSSVVSSSPPYEPHDITIIIVRDVLSRITKLVFWKCKQIPPLLLRVVGICVPYHLYLTKLEVRRGPSHGFGLKEIARILAHSYLSEICLDDSPLAQRNFHILVEANTTLRRLSLARCGIDDEACASLAFRLAYPQPASESLVSLSLTSNFITDEGAKAVGNTFRSNRALLHLDLAGNYLTDAGTAVILQPLMEFPLTEEEVRNKCEINCTLNV